MQVLATNRIGDSAPSAQQSGTPADVPDAPMVTVSNTNADGDALSSMELRVSWEVPANNGAEIDNYTVQWKLGTQDYGGVGRERPRCCPR